MESIPCRVPARCVAVFNLVVSCILVLLFATLLIMFLSGVKISGKENHDFLENIWFVLIIYSISTILGIWLSVILVKATSPTIELKKGLGLTKMWVNFNFIFLVLGGILIVVSEMKAFNGIGLLLHLVFIMIVYEYKRELQKKVEESELQVKFDNRDEVTA